MSFPVFCSDPYFTGPDDWIWCEENNCFSHLCLSRLPQGDVHGHVITLGSMSFALINKMGHSNYYQSAKTTCCRYDSCSLLVIRIKFMI